jgi:hypothetical protein
MSTSNITNNLWNSGLTAFTGSTPTAPLEAGVIETEKEHIEVDDPISYAELTKIDVSKAAAKGIQLASGLTSSISVRQARLRLDQTKIILLNSRMVARFPVDPIIRYKLEQLENLTRHSNALGYPSSFFADLKNGRVATIAKERADACNQYFKEKNLGNGSEIFDLERIFKLAMSESLSPKTEKKLCERVFIKFDDKLQKELKELPKSVRRASCFRQQMREIIRKVPKKITIKDAFIINVLADKVIFHINKETIVRLPSLENVEALNFSKNGTPEFSLLTRAIQEAKEEAERVVNGSRKRPSSDTRSDDLVEPSLKKQRIADDDNDTSCPQLPSFAELEDNLLLQRVTNPHASKDWQNEIPSLFSLSEPIDCYFQCPMESPVVNFN